MTVPRLIFLAGPNGAGKSTFHEAFLVDTGLEFVNADRLTAGLHIDNEEAAVVADQLRLEMVMERRSFITETVFSDPVGAKVKFLRDATAAGYAITLYYIGLSSSELSGARVWQRAQAGGHDVPPERLARRYAQSLINLAAALRFVSTAHVFDNSSATDPFRLVVTTRAGVVQFARKPHPPWLKSAMRERK